MSDAIVNQTAQQLAQQAQDQGAGGAEAKLPTEEVDAADQAAFDNAMNGEVDEASADVATQSVDEADAAEHCEPGDKKCLGEAILDGLEHIKTSHDAHLDRIQTQLAETGGENMSVQDAMRLQFEVMQMHIEQDLTTKMADKTSNGVQTMFRNQ